TRLYFNDSVGPWCGCPATSSTCRCTGSAGGWTRPAWRRSPKRCAAPPAGTCYRFASMGETERDYGVGDPDSLDTGTAHIARVDDYWLGGKDHFAADREAGDEAIEAFPGLISSVRANRAFLARTVRYLAGEAGIRQFLDIGTGIPSPDNTHEV